MRYDYEIFSAFGKIMAGLIAIASGIVTLIFNDIALAVFEGMSKTMRGIVIVLIIVIGIITLITSVYDMVVSFKGSYRTYRLKYQSKKFIDFFTKWYGKPGELSIICDDLDWIRTEDSDSIFNQLKKKSKANQLRVYLGRGLNSSIAVELKSMGAQVFSAPQSITQNCIFSCLAVMGNNASRVIVRTKQNDRGSTVVFDEIYNTYVTELLNTLLKTMNG